MKIGSIKEVTEIIKNHDNIVIFHHIRPDGDCLGSQFGLKQLILDNFPNKTVKTVGDSKGILSFLDFQFQNDLSDDFLKSALAIIVDANFKERIEKRELLDKNIFKSVIRIDHHPNEDDLNTDVKWVDSSYIAAAEQIAHLAVENKWTISAKAAEYIYTGIYTDSGRFLYSNTSSRTLFLASELWKTDMNIEKIHSNLTKNSENDLRFQAYILSNFKRLENVIYYSMDLETQKKFNKDSAAATRPNILANIDNYRIWLSFTQEEDKKWRVEFRSNGPVVRNVAVKWGGGGHERASGAIINDVNDIEKIAYDCQQEFENWNKHN
ncbi:DHH family phosphoesterase [Mesomycoplasma lagogenitalium]|uniref:Bifunctional oligoribonuclease/PAP phosphatase NrnA n=1 Tax=Mesomycoplasma lagogenitalium TaxID=171286 RepID=A0ABY8LU33_9BACT|nr:bifunctional oligoribonuclease/PAP phosphatase NrnA [Mesomycoplasma lagogenitalium]WGI36739.1 bifunctional oligoribonuclease/PAP phosphatase NrnA [Mesomycoplasma lagogenitalium]